MWSPKSQEQNGIYIVKLWCRECCKDFGGANGDHFLVSNRKLYIKFKKGHIIANIHIQNWYCWKAIDFYSHLQFATPKGRLIFLIATDHRATIVEALIY